MFGLENLDALLVIWAWLFQIILIAHFALRKWRFDVAIRYRAITLLLKIVTISWTEYKRPEWMIPLGGYAFVLPLVTGLTFAASSLVIPFGKAG